MTRSCKCLLHLHCCMESKGSVDADCFYCLYNSAKVERLLQLLSTQLVLVGHISCQMLVTQIVQDGR